MSSGVDSPSDHKPTLLFTDETTQIESSNTRNNTWPPFFDFNFFGVKVPSSPSSTFRNRFIGSGSLGGETPILLHAVAILPMS